MRRRSALNCCQIERANIRISRTSRDVIPGYNLNLIRGQVLLACPRVMRRFTPANSFSVISIPSSAQLPSSTVYKLPYTSDLIIHFINSFIHYKNIDHQVRVLEFQGSNPGPGLHLSLEI